MHDGPGRSWIPTAAGRQRRRSRCRRELRALGLVVAGCVATGAFSGWAGDLVESGPVTLANKHAEIGVWPAHGLIMGFGRPRQSNLLWVNPHPLASTRDNGWVNYGGEKLWWAPMSAWSTVTGREFPPDEALDGMWRIVGRSADRLVMQSGVSPWVGIQADREIALAAEFPGAVIRNRFTRVIESQQAVQLWTVCQIPPPRWSWLEARPAPGGAPYVNLRPPADPQPFVRYEAAVGLVRCVPSDDVTYMIGTRGGWLAAVYDDYILVHVVAPFPDGDYPDGVAVQLFSTTGYIELETLSGQRNLRVGESLENTVRWRLFERPAGLGEKELGAWLRERVGRWLQAPNR